MPLPDIAGQKKIFDAIRDDIDQELRATGFEELLSARGLDVNAGKLVVGRSFTYSTDEANIDIDLDPLATRLETFHMAGVYVENSYRWGFHTYPYSQAPHGEPQTPLSEEAEDRLDLDYIQFAVAEAGIHRLLVASRTDCHYMTKSLMKIDYWGD